MLFRSKYTACSRVKKSSDLKIYNGPIDFNKLNAIKHKYKTVKDQNLLKSKVNTKIKAHKDFDNKHGLSCKNEQVVDYKWFKKQLDTQNKKCHYCSAEMKTVYGPLDSKQFSIDRINDNFGHVKQNCVLSCLGCNRSKTNWRVRGIEMKRKQQNDNLSAMKFL